MDINYTCNACILIIFVNLQHIRGGGGGNSYHYKLKSFPRTKGS